MNSLYKKIFIIPVLVFWFLQSNHSLCQDTVRARSILKKLTAKKMAGRGYLFDGHHLGSEYISKEMQTAGLKPLESTYFQEFKITQNLFPKTPKLEFKTQKLRCGVDFIPAPDCPSVSGRFMLKKMDSIQLEAFIEKENLVKTPFLAWVIPEKLEKRMKKTSVWEKVKASGPGLIIFSRNKLTHSLSDEQIGIPSISCLSNSIPKEDSSLKLEIEARLEPEITTRNVIGFLQGTEKSDSCIVICAHYDHLGSMGRKVYFPGANDNASGISMMLEMAHHFNKNRPRFNLLFIAFSGEEAGILGSFFFVNHPLIPLEKIRFVLNLDLMGFGDKGATVVNGSVFQKQFERLKELNSNNQYLPVINARGKASNSDHYPFSEKGVPAFFIYTLGGPGYYHDVFDKQESVNFSKFTPTFKLLTSFIESF